MEIIIKGSPAELAELLAGLRTKQAAGAKEDAPQIEAAEQSHKIRYFDITADELKKISQGISERRSTIASMRS